MSKLNKLSFNILIPVCPSKQDEMDVLKKLQEKFQGNHFYLASLFTPQFTGWCSQKIRDDVGPDLYAWWEGADSDKGRKLEDARVEIERLKNEYNSFEEKHNFMTNNLRKERESLKTELEAMIDEKAIEVNRVDLLVDTQRELQSNYSDACTKNEDLEAEVLKLKAHLYDLEHA